MSHIISQKENLIILKELVNDFYRNGMNQENIEFALNNLTPKNRNLIQYKIKSKSIVPIAFFPTSKTIEVNIDKTDKIIDHHIKEFKQENLNYSKFKAYYILYALTHEIEHAYQYLISKNVIEEECQTLKNAYKEMFKIIDYTKTNYNTITNYRFKLARLIYLKNQNLYILERNANLESMDLISFLAHQKGEETIYNIFNNMKKITLKCGYIKNNEGCIMNTFEGLLLKDRYEKFYKTEDLSQEERAWVGLSINDDTREKILKLNIDITKCI